MEIEKNEELFETYNPEVHGEKAEEQPQKEETPESSLDTESKNNSPESESQAEPEKQQEQEPEKQQEQEPEKQSLTFESDDQLAKAISDYLGEDIDQSKLSKLKGEDTNPLDEDELVKEIYEYRKSGGDIKTYLDYKFEDFNKYDDKEIVKKRMKAEDPELTNAEIDRLFNRKYKLDEDLHDEDEVEDSKILLKKDAKNERKYFNELKEKYTAPLEYKAPEKQDDSLSEEELKNIQADLSENLKGIEKLELDGLTYVLDEEKKSKIEKMPTFIEDMFVDEKGNYDYNLHNKARVVLSELDNIVKAAKSAGRTEALKGLEKDRINPSFTPENAPEDSDVSGNDLLEHMAAQRKHGFSMNL